MKRITRKKQTEKKNVGKVLAGALVGSVVGATVGLLMAPASGQEIRSRIKDAGQGSRRSLQKKIETAEGNVESRTRELASEANEEIDAVRKTVIRRRKTAVG